MYFAESFDDTNGVIISSSRATARPTETHSTLPQIINLSSRGTASAATELDYYYDNKWLASLALDGNHDGQMHNNSCFHSISSDARPWWKLTFDKSYVIHKVIIYNRVDCGDDCAGEFKL